MRTDIIGENSPDNTTWWTVDLGGVYTIYSVNILFKNYDGFGMYFISFLNNFKTYVIKTEFYKILYPIDNPIIYKTCMQSDYIIYMTFLISRKQNKDFTSFITGFKNK